MFIAEQKKNENIAEYVLYMWQLEDILRAYKFNIELIQSSLIDPTNHSDEKKNEARYWYLNLIEQMKSEEVEKAGHLSVNKDLVSELTLFHSQLLKNPKELKYVETYYKTLPFIVELRAKSKDKDISEIETCFTALYGYLMLKLQQKEISAETASAISQITNLLRTLSEKYHSLSKKEN